jgi:hypothetical protein
MMSKYVIVVATATDGMEHLESIIILTILREIMDPMLPMMDCAGAIDYQCEAQLFAE